MEVLLEFVKQTTLAMSYLEAKACIHRYLTCRNVLVFHKSLVRRARVCVLFASFFYSRTLNAMFSSFKVKVADVGLYHLNGSRKSTDEKFSFACASPEVIRFRRFSSASDVFAFGVFMWQCYNYGQQPWKDMSNDQVKSRDQICRMARR